MFPPVFGNAITGCIEGAIAATLFRVATRRVFPVLDEVVAQLGDMIVMVDLASRKAGFPDEGRGPVVELQQRVLLVSPCKPDQRSW